MAHFLSPMLRRSSDGASSRFGLRVRDATVWLATDLRPAFDSGSRRRGLLGRDGLAPGEALVIAPCTAIHTARMRFPIDVVFTSREGRILKVAAAVPAWRVRVAWRAFAVVELAAGAAARHGLERGVVLEVQAQPSLEPGV